MKKRYFCAAAAIVICASFFSCTEQSGDRDKKSVEKKQQADADTGKKLVIRCDLWPPYNDRPDAPLSGSFIEILKAIFEKEGYTIDYELMPYNRSLQGVRDGTFDATLGTVKSEAPDLVFPEEPIGKETNAFFVKRGTTWRYTGVSSLERIKIGVIDGYNYDPAVDEYIKRNRNSLKVQVMVGDRPVEKNIKKLLLGRFDAVLETVDVMNWTLSMMNIGPDKVVEAGRIPTQLFMYVAFSPKRKSSLEHVRIFDRGIRDLRYSGKLKTILQRYSQADWK
ncbi:MAG TPA: transporter substrate-binding domain-containing protein [Spirochaetota bacterium]|nr:transporter substrate-binding domain-containing protein [Spirochaetota bacterium]HPC42856.1 transporter substrate-binding domain-containing protein [Spirochaetota bacterium]HQF07128.1 transporter substrate-binding domain-containing protein [Spirochaetota bacterium]HQH95865.1 transporter substrate-binding domain-containing protein [Spirochaetota bacterium]HQJ72055.1 transporter substrate-binding domain-containing protein [Spirochaetota bacterium]